MSDSRRKGAHTQSDDRSLWAVFMGLICLIAVLVIVAVRWNDPSGVAALGAVASSIAAILSGYFSIQARTYNVRKGRRVR
jgi:hypothetical protein